jgi:hypothetical protein
VLLLDLIHTSFTSLSLRIAAFSASNVTMSFFAMNLSFTMTEGHDGGFFSAAYAGEVFLVILISAPSSFSARPAVSMMDFQRFPIGSLTYSVMVCFFISVFSLLVDIF